MEPNIMSRD
jgi:ankyrin repeat protein